MINTININSAGFKGASIANNKAESRDKAIENFQPGLYMTPEDANSIKNYTILNKPTDITRPVSLSEYTSKLTASGLTEGKDFKVYSSISGANVDVIKDNKTIKSIHWVDGHGSNCYTGYSEFSYPNNEDFSFKTVDYDRYGNVKNRSLGFTNPDKYKNLFPENIDINTTPEEYISILDKANVRYRTGVDSQSGDVTKIYEYDNNGTITKVTQFDKTPNFYSIIQQNTPDANGNLTNSIMLAKDDERYEMELSHRFY